MEMALVQNSERCEGVNAIATSTEAIPAIAK